MTYRDLEPHEQLLLVALLHRVAEADRTVSREERAELDRVAADLGQLAFSAAAQEAERRFSGWDDLGAFAATVVRPEARELILHAAQDMAVTDEVAHEEMQIVSWLSDIWDI